MYDIGYKLIIIDEGVDRAAQVMKKQLELFNTKLQELLLELDEEFLETDIEFLAYLAEGTQEGYEHAFAINPDKLSEKMKHVLADYAIHLFEAVETENCTGLELLCNAMLSITVDSSSEEFGRNGAGSRRVFALL